MRLADWTMPNAQQNVGGNSAQIENPNGTERRLTLSLLSGAPFSNC